jgi:hypothetical protein
MAYRINVIDHDACLTEKSCKVMPYIILSVRAVVDDAEETFLFCLQNTRGKELTQLTPSYIIGIECSKQI